MLYFSADLILQTTIPLHIPHTCTHAPPPAGKEIPVLCTHTTPAPTDTALCFLCFGDAGLAPSVTNMTQREGLSEKRGSQVWTEAVLRGLEDQGPLVYLVVRAQEDGMDTMALEYCFSI